MALSARFAPNSAAEPHGVGLIPALFTAKNHGFPAISGTFPARFLAPVFRTGVRTAIVTKQ
jgi:hypothetical protein